MSAEQNIFEVPTAPQPLDDEHGAADREALHSERLPAGGLFETPGFDEEQAAFDPGSLTDGPDERDPYRFPGRRPAPRLSLSPSSRARLRQIAIFAAFAVLAFLFASFAVSLLRGTPSHRATAAAPPTATTAARARTPGSSRHARRRRPAGPPARQRAGRRTPSRHPRASRKAASRGTPAVGDTSPARPTADESPVPADPRAPSVVVATPAPEPQPSVGAPVPPTNSEPPADAEFSFER
jgi:hypothetical protein